MTSVSEGKPIKPPIRRSKNGCLTCRSRKVKCDERPQVCERCEKLEITCQWPMRKAASSSSRYASAETQKRPKDSFYPTSDPTVSKVICSEDGSVGEDDSAPSRSRKSPSYHSHSPHHHKSTTTLRFADKRNLTHSSVQQKDDMSGTFGGGRFQRSAPSQEELERLVGVYYSHCYPVQAQAFIHRGQLNRQIREGRASPLLLRSICALSYRFSEDGEENHPDGGRSPAIWAQQVKNELMQDTDRYSLTKLAATMNLVMHEGNSGRRGSQWLLVSLSTRMALAMALNSPGDQSQTWLEQETRRRLMWAAFSLEAHMSGGHRQYLALDPHNIEVDLPTSELDYLHSVQSQSWSAAAALGQISDYSIDPQQTVSQPKEGYMARHVWLMMIRNDLLHYTKNVLEYPGRPWDPDSRFHHLVKRLKDFEESLSLEMEWSIDNLYVYKSNVGELTSLVIMHLWHEFLFCSLYRISLPGFDESAPIDYLSDAPPGWVDDLRNAGQLRARAIVHKFRLLSTHCPDTPLATTETSLFAYEVTRNLLAFYSASSDEVSGQQHNERLEDFEIMLNCLGKSLPYFYSLRRVLRDIVVMLARHGYIVGTHWNQKIHGITAPHTPSQAFIRRKMHWFARHIRYAANEDPSNSNNAQTMQANEASQAVTMCDPVSQDTVIVSPSPQAAPSTHDRLSIDIGDNQSEAHISAMEAATSAQQTQAVTSRDVAASNDLSIVSDVLQVQQNIAPDPRQNMELDDFLNIFGDQASPNPGWHGLQYQAENPHYQESVGGAGIIGFSPMDLGSMGEPDVFGLLGVPFDSTGSFWRAIDPFDDDTNP